MTAVSGLSEGMETVAHGTTIEKDGKMIAARGTSLSQAYLANNKALLEAIECHHLALNRFPEDYPPKRDKFPCCSRTMASNCLATVVVEASENCRTLHQA